MKTLPLSYSLKNIMRRKTTTLLTIGGMSLVVFVFATTLMMARGLEKALEASGSEHNVVLLRKGSSSEVMSSIERSEAAIVEMFPEIAIDPADGKPLAAREISSLLMLTKKDGKTKANVSIRGIGEKSHKIREQVKMLAGRMPRQGVTELAVGNNIAQRFSGIALGSTISWGGEEWLIVGIFDAGSTSFNSEVWADNNGVMRSFRRNAYSAVIFRKNEAASIEQIQRRMEDEHRLPLEAKDEVTYYRDQSKMMAIFLRVLGIFFSVSFSIGAIIGAMITAQNAVANRVAEIGTLRALGFQRWDILQTFLLEAVIMGACGGMIGVFFASLMQFVDISTVNFQTFSEISFGFTLTPGIALSSLIFAIFMGIAGGILPSWRASRLNIVDALRDA
ncbi:MAG: ABC transporter permease [Deltaproteobacteria bacterium]|nr:ABC transporter permease [Deltaproteobacteria bacterium]